jgi:putative alpha-1,2-mannosidase
MPLWTTFPNFNFMKRSLCILLLFSASAAAQKTANLIQYVKPIIGTQRMGHTYPGATVPFGMVQLSPDTDSIPLYNNGKYNPDVYKYCAGYQYDDKTIVVSATRISVVPGILTLVIF